MSVYIAIVFVCFAGFFLASYLFHKKHEKKEHFICPFRGRCSEVIQSEFSKFMGMPVEVMGLVYYAGLAIGYGATIAFPSVFGWLILPLLIASTLAFFFSMYLTFIQIVSIRKFCTWCLTSAAFCTIIFGLALFGSYELVEPFLVQFRSPIYAFHVLFMGFGIGAATLNDVLFFKFLKDLRISEQEAAVLKTVNEFIWFAIGFILLTGLALYLPELGPRIGSSQTLMKMLIFLVIIVNAAFLNLTIAPKLVRISFGQEHDHKAGELVRARRLAFLLGPVSLVSWYSAFVVGVMPTNAGYAFREMLTVYVVLLIVGMVIGWIHECRLCDRKPSS